MKATGIVRRIDDLGRVVVPKEIRRTMRIREGQAMEIFTGREGEIVLSVPLRCPAQRADAFIQEKSRWIFIQDGKNSFIINKVCRNNRFCKSYVFKNFSRNCIWIINSKVQQHISIF